MYTQSVLVFLFAGMVMVSAESCPEVISRKMPECTKDMPQQGEENPQKDIKKSCEQMKKSADCLKELIASPECEEGDQMIESLEQNLNKIELQTEQFCSNIESMKCTMEISENVKKCQAKALEVQKESKAEPEPKDGEKKEGEDKEDTEKQCKAMSEVIDCFKDAIDVDGCEETSVVKRIKEENMKVVEKEYSEHCSSAALLASLFTLMASIFISTTL